MAVVDMSGRRQRRTGSGRRGLRGAVAVPLALLCALLVVTFAPGLHRHAGPEAPPDNCALCRISSTSPLDLPAPVASLGIVEHGPARAPDLLSVAPRSAIENAPSSPRAPPPFGNPSHSA